MIIPVRSRVKLFPSVALVSVLALEICPRIAQTQNATNAPKVDYQRDVQPILQTHCYSCHGAAAQMSGLRLDSRQALLAGGNERKDCDAGSRGRQYTLQAPSRNWRPRPDAFRRTAVAACADRIDSRLD